MTNTTHDFTPETQIWQRRLLMNGVILLLGGLVAGLTIGLAPNPRTVLAAHVIGLTTGMAAMLVGLLLPLIVINTRWLNVLVWTLLPSLHLGFITQWVGGLGGLSRMFTVTAAGQPEGAAWLETIVEYIVKGITPLTLIPFVILIVALAKSQRRSGRTQ
jgi:hypothetical protein